MQKDKSTCCGGGKTAPQKKPDGATRGAREDYPAKLTPDDDNKSATQNGKRERIR
ncbi:MAG: hypothetical protein JWM96_1226 [Alphaproteobacteria bacterium]|nr:hypothetical protein [Alphaproteobacteria bacterium]